MAIDLRAVRVITNRIGSGTRSIERRNLASVEGLDDAALRQHVDGHGQEVQDKEKALLIGYAHAMHQLVKTKGSSKGRRLAGARELGSGTSAR